MDLYDLLLAKSLGGGGGGGGGSTGKLALLGEFDLGTVETTSTSSQSLGRFAVEGIYDYDWLFVAVEKNETPGNDEFVGSVAQIVMLTTTTYDWIYLAVSNQYVTMLKTNDSGVARTRADTTSYGIYPASITIAPYSAGSTGTATISMTVRYNSVYSGTISGTYTMRVYGLKLFDRPNKKLVL